MYNLDNIIPQKPPMKVIDRVISFENEIVHAQAEITAEHLFYDATIDGIPHWVAVEIMAQTAAVYGKLNLDDTSEEPKIAFLMSIRNYKTEVTKYDVGMVLDVYAECIMLDNGVSAFEAKIEVDGQEMASIKINAYQPQNDEQAEAVLSRKD